MIKDIKIGIVEDELLIAEKIKILLMEIGYQVAEPVSTYQEALDMVRTDAPDMLLLDINLGAKKDGIDIAQTLNEQHPLPFIFLTANSDAATIERAKAVKPYAYLVKPFTKDDLFAAIEIAFAHAQRLKQTVENTLSTLSPKQNFMFVKDNHRFIKIAFDTIVYVESMENYVIIHTKDKKKATIRSTFSEFLASLPTGQFQKIHRSYAVQIGLIDNIDNLEVVVAGQKILMSAPYRAGLFAALGIK